MNQSAIENESVKVDPKTVGGRGITQAISGAFVILAFVQPVARLLARYDWRADLIVHFQDAALLITVLAIVTTWRRWRICAVVLSAVAIWQASGLLAYDGVRPPTPISSEASPRLRILFSNVLCTNTNYAPLEQLIRDQRPDIVALVEVSSDCILGLQNVRSNYPYRAEVPWGAIGMSLWFRAAPVRVDPPKLSTPGGWPYIHAVIRFAGQDRHLWLVHPMSPLQPARRIRGYPELLTLSHLVGDVEGSRIVVGDLNTSEASPYFGDMLKISGLRDSRLGFGRQTSWPSWFPVRITIDHALVSHDLAVLDRRQCNPIGSDHLPFVLDLASAAGPSDISMGSMEPRSATISVSP